MSQNGKGDTPRKKTVNEDIWARNWERIFGKKTDKKPVKKA
jgi:hypothetical protein